jgi:branched-chain amino acid transport system permease protein
MFSSWPHVILSNAIGGYGSLRSQGRRADRGISLTAETIIQSLASGLLMGLLYGLIAVGLALIFGLMDVVNFAHGEFLMIAMYATFFLFAFFAIDPLLSAPLVAAALFVFGAVVYLLIVRFAVRAKANAGMVQIFSTFGLAIVMRGVAQFFFTPDYRSVTHSWLGGKTVSIGGIFLPVPQLVGALVAIAAFGALYFFINRTDFGRALEATREDAGAVALVGIDKNRVFALGWGLGAALVGLAGAIMAMFFYIYPDVGASFALIAYVTVALGGFGSVFGAFAGGIIVGLVEATTALDPAAVAEVGRHLRGLSAGGLRPAARPVRIDVMDTDFAQRRRRDLIVAFVPCRDRRAGAAVRQGRLRPEHHGSDADVCGAVAELEYPQRLLRADFARPRALFRARRLHHRDSVHQVRRAAVVRHARRRPDLGASRWRSAIPASACAGITSSSPPSSSPRSRCCLFQNWDWAGAALGIDIPVRGDSWLKFQFTRSKLPYFYFALALACVAWLVTWWLEDSKWGYWWRAVKDNPDAAESLGVVVFNSKMGAAAVSAFLTAVGGSFYAQFVSYIDPESVMGFQFSLLMALPAVLGGIGTLWGPVLGAVILIPLTELTRSFIGGSGRGVDLIVYGGLIVLISLARPQGLVGLFSRRRKEAAR